MTNNQQRAHDLALKVAEFVYGAKTAHPTYNPTHMNVGFYETYINAYNDFLEALERDDPTNE